MTLAIDNPRSSIARELVNLLTEKEDEDVVIVDDATPWSADRYLFCGGFLLGKSLMDTSAAMVAKAYFDNFSNIAATCDLIIENNAAARICIIGSESGFAGSFDMAYAGAKAALHLYVETKRLATADQQIVAIAPHVIIDSGMTARRSDYELCVKRGSERRRGRWLLAKEVAAMVHHALYVDTGALCNTVIRMNGGIW